jgi:hypothetical protein
MPKYNTGYEVIDVPFEEMEKFESLFPKAKQLYDTGKETLEIPLDKRQEFTSLFPDATQMTSENESNNIDTSKLDISEEDVDTKKKAYEEQQKAGLSPEPIKSTGAEFEKKKKEEFETDQTDLKFKLNTAKSIDKNDYFLENINSEIDQNRDKISSMLGIDAEISFNEAENAKNKAKQNNIISQKAAFYKLFPEVDKDTEIRKDIEKQDKLLKDQKYLKMTNNILDDQLKYLETKDGKFLKTLGDKITDTEFITLGLKSVTDNVDVAKLALKYKDDPESLSESEKNALMAYGMFNTIRSQTKTSTGYDIAESVAEMIPYMVQFAAGAPFASAARTGAEKLTTGITNKWIKKGIEYAVGELAGTITGSAPAVIEQTAERMMGDVGVQNGEVNIENQQNFPEAFTKSLASAWSERYSEQFGRAGAEFMKSKPAQSLIKKIGADRVLDEFPNKSKLLKNIEEAIGMQDVFSEFILEELPQPALEAAVTMEKDPLRAYDKDELKKMGLSIITVKAMLSTLGTPSYVLRKRSEYVDAKKTAEREILTKTKMDIDKILDSGKDYEEISKDINDYISLKLDEGASIDDMMKIDQYVNAKTAFDAFKEQETQNQNDLQQLKQKENEKANVQQAVDKKEKTVKENLKEQNIVIDKILSKEIITNRDLYDISNIEENTNFQQSALNNLIEIKHPGINDQIQSLKDEKALLYKENLSGVELQKQGDREQIINKELKSLLIKKNNARNAILNSNIEILDQPILKKIEQAKGEYKAEEVLTDKPSVEAEQVTKKDKAILGEEVKTVLPLTRILKSDPEKSSTTPIELNGEKIGELTVEKNEGYWDVKRSDVDPDYQGKGYGKNAYRQMNEKAQENGSILRSDLANKMTDDSQGLWNSLIKSGEAVKTEDGRFEMISIQKTEKTDIKLPEQKAKVDGRKIDRKFDENEQQLFDRAEKYIGIKENVVKKFTKSIDEFEGSEQVSHVAEAIQYAQAEKELENLFDKGNNDALMAIKGGYDSHPSAGRILELKLDSPELNKLAKERNDMFLNIQDKTKGLSKEGIKLLQTAIQKTDMLFEDVNNLVNNIKGKTAKNVAIAVQLKLNEEPKNAEKIRSNKEQLREEGGKPEIMQDKSSEDIQRNEKAKPETGNGEKAQVTFEWMGDEKTGDIIEQGKDFVKVKDDTGTVHTITPKSTMYKNVKGVDFEVKTKTEEESPEFSKALKGLADKVRQGKINKIGGFRAGTAFDAVWDASLEVLATTLEATADLAQAIDKAYKHIINSDWYKKQNSKTKKNFDKTFKDHLEKELGDEYRGVKKRKYAKRFEAFDNVDKQIKEKIRSEDKYYIPISNEITESQAKEIIDANGLTGSKTIVLDFKNEISPRVRVALAYHLIEKYNANMQSESDAKVKEGIANDAAEVATEIGKYGTELGQGVQAYRVHSKLNSFTLKQKTIKDIEDAGVEMNKEIEKELDRLLDAYDKAKEGRGKFKALEDIERFKQRIAGLKKRELLMAIWYANVLSGPRTHIKNMSANLANAAGEVVVSVVKNPKRATSMLKSLFQGYGRGMLEMSDIFMSGYSQLRSSKTLDYDISKVDALELKEFKGGRWNPLNYLKYVGRAMKGADAFAYHGLKNMRLNEMVAMEAIGMGLKTNREINNYVDKKLFNTKEKYKKALEAAKSEGLTGLEAKLRAYELIDQARPDIVEYTAKNKITGKTEKIRHEMDAEASDFASYGTFNHRPEGTLGVMTDYAGKISDSIEIPYVGIKPLKFVIPFTRIISNVTNRYLDWSPYGFIRAARGESGLLVSNRNSSFIKKYNLEEKQKLMIKATLGTTAMMYMVMKALRDDDDEFEITANGTDDYRKNYELAEGNRGWKPYSIRIGDTWVNYQNTPFSVPFMIAGKLADMAKYEKVKFTDEDFLTKTSIVIWNAQSYVMDMTFLKGMSEFMNIISETNTSAASTKLKKLMFNSAKSFVIPNGYTQVARQIMNWNDIPMTEANGLIQTILRDTPIAYSKRHPLINSLGEEVVSDNVIFNKQKEYDPVWDLIVSNKAWIGKPSTATTILDEKEGITRKMTDDEYWEYCKIRGDIIRSKITDNMPKLKEMSEDDVRYNINEIVKPKASKAAKKVVYYKNNFETLEGKRSQYKMSRYQEIIDQYYNEDFEF